MKEIYDIVTHITGCNHQKSSGFASREIIFLALMASNQIFASNTSIPFQQDESMSMHYRCCTITCTDNMQKYSHEHLALVQ